MFEELIKGVLGDVEIQIRDQVLHQFNQIGKSVVVDQIAQTCSHTMLKGIDGVIAACVSSLGKGDAQKLMDAYTGVLRTQINQFTEVISLYAPMQLSVELAKKTWGDKSKQANDARALRAKGIADFRTEFKDILKVIVGETPSD